MIEFKATLSDSVLSAGEQIHSTLMAVSLQST